MTKKKSRSKLQEEFFKFAKQTGGFPSGLLASDSLPGSPGSVIQFTDMEIDEDGTEIWTLNGKLHRSNDEPAVVSPCGYKEWWLYGKIHRVGKPAIEYPDGTRAWYVNGMNHRLDGPAMENFDGTKYWFIENVMYTEEEFNNYKKI